MARSDPSPTLTAKILLCRTTGFTAQADVPALRTRRSRRGFRQRGVSARLTQSALPTKRVPKRRRRSGRSWRQHSVKADQLIGALSSSAQEKLRATSLREFGRVGTVPIVSFSQPLSDHSVVEIVKAHARRASL
jgi:hypothetical protein